MFPFENSSLSFKSYNKIKITFAHPLESTSNSDRLIVSLLYFLRGKKIFMNCFLNPKENTRILPIIKSVASLNLIMGVSV